MPVKFDRPMVKRLFDKTDVDGSGGLDREEIQGLVNSLGTGADLAAFDEIDSDGNGIVEFEEFYQWYNKFSDQMAALKAVAEAERAEAEAQIARWAESHSQRAAEHEQEWQAQAQQGRKPREPRPPDSPRVPPRRRVGRAVDTRVWRLQSFALAGCGKVFDGVWVVDDSNPLVHDKPHFVNQYGCHAFFAPAPARWVLHTELLLDDADAAVATRECDEGHTEFPLGERAWMIWRRLVPGWEAGSPGGDERVEATLSMSERTRPPSIGGLGCLDVLPEGRVPQDPPTAQEVADYAVHLGISAEMDQHLFWVAEEALCAPLPQRWVEHVHAETGHIFYRGPGADGKTVSTHWHPLEQQYKVLLHKLRELVSEVRGAFEAADEAALEAALAVYAAAVQRHREAIQTLLTVEVEDALAARELRFRVGVFAVRTVLTLPVLPPTKNAPQRRTKSGGDQTAAEVYIPAAFAAHYPTRHKATARLRAEGHTDEDIKKIEAVLRRIMRPEPSLLRRGARRVMHAHHQRAPARLPPRATALAAKTATARLKGQGMAVLTAAELTRHLAHIHKGEPVSGHAGEHQEHDTVAEETATRLDKQRLGNLHMADRAGADALMPLHVAARKGDADTVANLLLDGADVNRRNFAQQTPLHEAAIQGRNEVVDLLLGETGVRTPFFCFCVGKREELRETHPEMDWKARNKELSILWNGTPATNAMFTGSNVMVEGKEDIEFPGWDFRQNPEQLIVEVDGVVKTTTLGEDCRSLDRAAEALSLAFRWGDEELDAMEAHEDGHSVHPTAQRHYYAKALHISVEDALHHAKMPSAFSREMHPICHACAAEKSLDEQEFQALAQSEFGFSPADAFAMELSALAERVPEGHTKLGKVSIGHVSKMLESKMPNDFTAIQAAQYLKDEYKLGPGRTDSVLLHGVTMQPRERCGSIEAAMAFLDSCAEAYGAARNVPMSKGGVVSDAPVSAQESLCVLLALKFLRPLSDVHPGISIDELNKCPAKHKNHERHDLLLAAKEYCKREQKYEREIVGGVEALVGADSDASEVVRTSRKPELKEVEADYIEKLTKLMKVRQTRRWAARHAVAKRRLARTEELCHEPGTDVAESVDDFRQRMNRNFLEGVDTLRTKRMIVEEIASNRLAADSGLATRATEQYGVNLLDVAAAVQSAEPKKALVALIVEHKVLEEETPLERVVRLLREAGPVTEQAQRLRRKLETIHHLPGMERLEPDLHRLELLKYAEKVGVDPELLQAVNEVEQEDRERALIALIMDLQITQMETNAEHVDRLLNEAARRTNKDEYDDLRISLDNVDVSSIAELAMRAEEQIDAEEVAMFANEKAKLDVMMAQAKAKANSEETQVELESNAQFHKRMGRLYNPKKGDRKLPLLASHYFEDTEKALGKLQHKRLMARDAVHKTLTEIHKRKMRLLPWATVAANTNDKLVITCGSTGLRSTIAVSADSGEHVLGLFGTEPKLDNGRAVRLPLSSKLRQPFIAKSMQCSRLCSKIDVEPVDQWGHTPLHVAARWEQKEVVQLILNHGGLIDGHGKRYTDSLFLRGNDAVELAARLRKICLIQGQWRYRMYQRWLNAWRASVIVLQNRWRFRAARKQWHNRRNAVITMQALFRGYKGRKRFALVKQQQAAPQLHLAWASFCKTTGRDHVCMLYRMGDCPHRTAGKCMDMQLPQWEEGGETTLRDELKKLHLEYLAPRRSTPVDVEPPREEWLELVQVCKKAGVALPMIEAYGAKHGGSNEPKRTEVLHFLKKPDVQKHLDLCGELIGEIHGPGMCFRNAADPDGMRVSKRGSSNFVSNNLFFSVSTSDATLDIEAIRNSVSSLEGFIHDPLKFRVTDDKTALMVFFESDSLAAQAMTYLQTNPKALPKMTEVVFGKQAKDKSSASQAKALFLELDDDGSGYLDADEVDALMKRMGKWMNKFEIAQCMAMMDEDGNNEVSLDEFEEWFKLNGNKFTSDEDTELTKMVEDDGRKALQAVNDTRPIHTIPEDELRSQGASAWASKAQRFSTGRSAEALKNRWAEIVAAEEKKPKVKITRRDRIRTMREKQVAAFAEQAQEAAIQEKEEAERAAEREKAKRAVDEAISLQNQHEDAELAAIERKQNLDKLRDANRCVVGDTRALSDDAYTMACALIQRTTVSKPLLLLPESGAGRQAAEQAARQLITSATEPWAADLLVEVASTGPAL
eukprot:COSAG06_NODE_1612_length_8935_cov_5.449411_3_plen_2191_part_00